MASRASSLGASYTFGGSGGSANQSGISGSMIGGGQAPLKIPSNNVTAVVNISEPLAGIIEGAAALKGTTPKNGFQTTNWSVFGVEGKVLGAGAGLDVYVDREKGLALDVDASAILGGTLHLDSSGCPQMDTRH